MKSEQLQAFVHDVFALPTGTLLFFKALYGYRWPTGQMAISNYVCTDYVITFLQYKSRIRMTPDPCAGARSRVWLRQTNFNHPHTPHTTHFNHPHTHTPHTSIIHTHHTLQPHTHTTHFTHTTHTHHTHTSTFMSMPILFILRSASVFPRSVAM